MTYSPAESRPIRYSAAVVCLGGGQHAGRVRISERLDDHPCPENRIAIGISDTAGHGDPTRNRDLAVDRPCQRGQNEHQARHVFHENL
jgi:hypothetical protein